VTDRLLTILALAQYICASTRTARRIVASGEIPSYKVRGRTLVRFADLERWLEANRIERTAAEKRNELKSLVARAVQRARERRSA
jgi:excisionase family DNA binding protein